MRARVERARDGADGSAHQYIIRNELPQSDTWRSSSRASRGSDRQTDSFDCADWDRTHTPYTVVVGLTQDRGQQVCVGTAEPGMAISSKAVQIS